MRKVVVENLAGLWMAYMWGKGINSKDAMRLLNASTGRRYAYRRWWEWSSGKRALPAVARTAMLRMALPYILKSFAIQITPENAAKLANHLT